MASCSNMKKEHAILGVKIDNFSKQEILGKVEVFLADGEFHQIVTVNPEFILEAQKNLTFREILNKSALSVADGFGITCAFWRFGQHLKLRIAGVDLMQEIIKIAEQKKLKIFLAINKDGLSSFEEICSVISKLYPNLAIAGADLDAKDTKYSMLDAGYQILLCNFGAPEQERFIDSQKNAIIGLGMGVGGSFDYLTGKISRAPLWMRKVGLEWLWRFFRQPKRFRRIFRSVVIFPLKVFWDGFYKVPTIYSRRK